MKTNKIALVFGGQSSEHEPTRKSFAFLYERIRDKGLRKDLEVSKVVYITKNGRAVLSDFDITKDPAYYEEIKRAIDLMDAFKVLKESKLFIYAIFYGQNGEDGRAQGMADFFSLKTNLGSVLSCALGMSKYHLNQYVKGNFSEIKVPLTVAIREVKEIKEKLALFKDKEIVIKPSSLGSSVLTEKMIFNKANFSKISSLINKILELDERALVQQYIKGVEYSVGCLEKDKTVKVLPAIRIETANSFFGQKEKFIAGYSKEVIVDEKDDPDLLKTAKKTAKEIFVDLDFRNAARFDFIITNSEIYFLEINPLPGILRNSILPRMLRTQGWDVENLVEICYDNENNKKQLNTQFFFEVDY